MKRCKNVAPLVVGMSLLTACSGFTAVATPEIRPVASPTPLPRVVAALPPSSQARPGVGAPRATQTVKVFFTTEDHLVAETAKVDADHPLQGATRAVLTGPRLDQDYSQVPSGSRLLHLALQQTTAYVDFNPTFFGPGGPLGLKLRLAQVVFTLTQFPKVRAVQFLVDGHIEATTGNQGYPIGHPFTRRDFPYLST